MKFISTLLAIVAILLVSKPSPTKVRAQRRKTPYKILDADVWSEEHRQPSSLDLPDAVCAASTALARPSGSRTSPAQPTGPLRL